MFELLKAKLAAGELRPVEPCEECGRRERRGQRHAITCSQISVEEKAAAAELYFKAYRDWQDLYRRHVQNTASERTYLQGKLAMLKHENNKLRVKVRRLTQQDQATENAS